MRKKSHISLARFLVGALDNEELKKHRFSFYLGSILPDIKPSFVYRRHEMEETYPSITKNIKRLAEGDKLVYGKRKGRKYFMDLGQISHYLADYFTFPHNEVYSGSLKEHCSYEKELKNDLREYIQGGEAFKQGEAELDFDDAEKLCDYIARTHEKYVGREHGIADDIEYIIRVNRQAVRAIIELLARRQAEYYLCR